MDKESIELENYLKEMSEKLCYSGEISASYTNDFRIGRFQLLGVKGQYQINYLNKEDFLNGNYKYKRTSEKEINYENTQSKDIIGYTVGSGEEFPATMYWDDLYPYVLSFLGAYEILTEKEKLSKEEEILKSELKNFIQSKDFIEKEEIYDLFEKTNKVIGFKDLLEKEKEALKIIEKERAEKKEEEKRFYIKSQEEQKARAEANKKQTRLKIRKYLSLAPISPILILLDKKKERKEREEKYWEEVKRHTEEIKKIRARKLEEVKEFENF